MVERRRERGSTKSIWPCVCYFFKFKTWLAIRASVCGVGGVLIWVTCLRMWRACVGGVPRVGVGGVLACVA